MSSLYNLTNLDKELWPGITKKDLVTYFLYVAPAMLEYVKDRPLSLVRAPDGVGGETFFQKNLPEHAPNQLRSWEYVRGKRSTRYLVLKSVEDFVYLGNQATIEIHSMLSTVQEVERPVEIAIDLDLREGTEFLLVKQGALLVKELLEQLGLRSYPKFTGKKGIHVMIPIEPEYTYGEIAPFLKALRELVVATYPELFTGHLRKEKRDAPIFLDIGQNGLEKTVIVPYSPRTVPEAKVAVISTWQDLERMVERPVFNVREGFWPPLVKAPQIMQGLPVEAVR